MKLGTLKYSNGETVPNKHKQFANQKPEVSFEIEIEDPSEIPAAWNYLKQAVTAMLDDAVILTHAVMGAESVGQRPLDPTTQLQLPEYPNGSGQLATGPAQETSAPTPAPPTGVPVSGDQPITINPPAYNQAS